MLVLLLGWAGDAFGTVNTCTTNGTTMLMLSCFGGHVATGKALLGAGAVLAARNAWDCDAGHFAGMGGCVGTLGWLAEECGVRLDRRQVRNAIID